MDEHPNGFKNDSQTVDCDAHQHSEKLVIVFASDTVIQVLAVMVKVLCASVTFSAVIAFDVNPAVAIVAASHFSCFVLLVNVEYQVIDGVGAGEEQVIICNEEVKDVGDCY